MSKRAIIRVQLTTPVKQQLDELCQQRGMTQIAVMSRLVDWFFQQNELVQAAVLGQLSEDLKGKLADQMLQQMAQNTDDTASGSGDNGGGQTDNGAVSRPQIGARAAGQEQRFENPATSPRSAKGRGA